MDNVTFQSATPATPPAGTIVSSDEDGSGAQVQRVKLAYSADGSSTHVSADANGLLVNLGSNNDVITTAVQDTGNSTSATLGNGGNFTGSGFLMNDYASWSVNVYADQASATNGLKVQWSDDNTNWDFTDQTTYVASVGNMITFGRKAKYVRLNYTNGTSPQGTFRVVAYAQPISVRQTRKFIGTQLVDADTGQVVVAALQGHTTAGGGAWVDVKVNPSGSLAVDASGAAVPVTDNSGSLTVDNAALSVTGGGVEASALRVTIASDSTGVLSVDDNGGSLTVDGTVTANLAAGTNNIGDVDVLSIAAGDNNIGNVDVVTLPALPTGTNVIGSVKITDGTDTALVDASGYLMVNVAAGGAGDGAILDGVSSAIKATVLDYTNSNPVAVRLTDTNGDYVSAGGGTQYTEDAAAAADPVGTMGMAVRADTLAAVTTTDGDNIALRATNKGELYVKQSDAVSVTGTVTANLAAGTNNIGDVDVLSIAAGDNNIGNVDIVTVPAPLSTTGGGTEAAALRVTIASDSTGVLSVDDNGGALTVDNGGTFAVQATIAAGATNIAKAEDVLSADADVGVPAMAVRKATPANTSGTDGDYEFLQMSAGRLWTSATIDAALPAGTNGIGKLTSNAGVTIGAVEIAATQTLSTVTTVGTVTTLTGGGIAHDSGDSGNPIKIGAKAETSPKGITLVADGDRTDLYADADGMLMVKLNTSFADLVSERVSDTGGSSTAFTNFSAVASTRNYITAITVYNSSASGGYVDFRDGAAGSVLWTMPVPAGGGSVISSGTPLFRTSANTALAYDVSGALTTVYISVSGFQSKAG